MSADDVAAFVCLAVYGDRRIGDDVSVGGPENLGFLEIARHLLALGGRPEVPAHIPLGALRVMSAAARPIRDRFPDIPATTLVEVTGGMASAGS